MPSGSDELAAMLYSRGLQPREYQPTLLDVLCVAWGVFDDPPVVIRKMQKQ